jgi:hypothetical protein
MFATGDNIVGARSTVRKVYERLRNFTVKRPAGAGGGLDKQDERYHGATNLLTLARRERSLQ